MPAQAEHNNSEHVAEQQQADESLSRRTLSCDIDPAELASNFKDVINQEKSTSTIRPRSSSLTEHSVPNDPSNFSASFSFEPIQPLDLDPVLIESITSPKATKLSLDDKSHIEAEGMSEQLSKLKVGKEQPATYTPEPSPISTKPALTKKVSGSQETEFDYTQFLDQIRSPQALPIVRYLENFVREFDKKPWTVRDQVKIVGEFTDFVLGKMLDSGVWEDESVDYLQEGIEQYLMNRLHNKAFSPLGSDDRERDHVLHQRARYFRWVEEKHLDIQIQTHRGYLAKAQQELIKLNNFKTPRHKMICILNCCKLLFKLLRKNESNGGGADSFLPLLIFTILKANPPKLISNLQYITRFRHPSRLQSESGYYLTNLVGAIQFIEGLEPASLTITREEFDANIEKTLQELAAETPQGLADTPLAQESPNATASILQSSIDSDKASQLAQRIKRPLDLVGKFFSDVTSPVSPNFNEPPPHHPVSQKERLSKKKSFLGSLFTYSSSDEEVATPQRNPFQKGQELISFANQSQSSDIAASLTPAPSEKRSSGASGSTQQSSIQPEQLPPNGTAYHFNDGINILRDIFPSFDNDVLQAVIGSQRGDLGASVDALLEMSAPDTNDLINLSST
ncbi:hypothetical protein DSO57_1001541 [Entomophthora muscae]|uniref:Uncharacterized protein n=1 Tax=Entomophthora muscae TaxID=34485 RepID=A0ACC2RNX8_9FUNG|nr:hypothetical protein DSO57_1001541 [Entomophthora muscae]